MVSLPEKHLDDYSLLVFTAPKLFLSSICGTGAGLVFFNELRKTSVPFIRQANPSISKHCIGSLETFVFLATSTVKAHTLSKCVG